MFILTLSLDLELNIIRWNKDNGDVMTIQPIDGLLCSLPFVAVGKKLIDVIINFNTIS